MEDVGEGRLRGLDRAADDLIEYAAIAHAGRRHSADSGRGWLRQGERL